MTKPLLPEIIEATRLTQAGRLGEATALLKKLLGRTAQNDASAAPATHTASPSVVDVVAEDVSPDLAEGKDSVRQETSAWQATGGAGDAKLSINRALADGLAGLSPGVQGQTFLRGLGRGPIGPSDVFPATGTFSAKSFSNGAGSRPYKLYVPSGHNGEPRPLIIMLHGCTQSPDDFAAGTRMNFAAEEHACFVAYPEQTATANSSKCWNWFHSSHQARDQGEPSLIAGIAKQITAEHNIDEDRIYIAGLSAGGAASAVVAEAYPDVFAALGVHSGLACGAARDLPSAFAAMQGRHAGAASSVGTSIPTIVFHGDNDTTVHPKNGVEVIARAVAGETFRLEVEHGRVDAGRSYTRSVHRAANGREFIEEWVIHGAGHAWAGGSAAGSFTDPLGPDATREMLRFFLEHKRAK